MTVARKNLGNAGESFAAGYLEARGYKILARNFRVRTAEIDIVAELGDTLVFVEVKTRKDTRHGQPAEAVNLRKQKKIIEAAGAFLQDETYADRPCRFDVIEIYSVGGNFFANHLEGAFEVQSEF